jgi:hypothetical protein
MYIPPRTDISASSEKGGFLSVEVPGALPDADIEDTDCIWFYFFMTVRPIRRCL